MKKLNLIYAILLLSALASCKKEAKPQTSTTKPPVAEVEVVSDSVSYTVDGKTYTAGGMGLSSSSSGGEDANRKLIFPDSTKKYEYSLIGQQDSILNFQEATIRSNSANINIYFVKKFARQPKVIYWPPLTDVLTMFTVGKRPYAEDFGWQNSQNGIALDLGYTTYNAYNGNSTITIQPGFQKNSTFQIISFTKAAFGYNLVAKFTAVVIDNTTGQLKQLDNGYLRLNYSPRYAVGSN